MLASTILPTLSAKKKTWKYSRRSGPLFFLFTQESKKKSFFMNAKLKKHTHTQKKN